VGFDDVGKTFQDFFFRDDEGGGVLVVSTEGVVNFKGFLL
jgi:hypothetical protein